MLYSGEFFPSVDVIAQAIERQRNTETAAATERRQDIYWSDFARNNREIEKFKAEHGGKTPQQVWCEENREVLAKLGRLDGHTVEAKAGRRLNSRVLVGVAESVHQGGTAVPVDAGAHTEPGSRGGDGITK